MQLVDNREDVLQKAWSVETGALAVLFRGNSGGVTSGITLGNFGGSPRGNLGATSGDYFWGNFGGNLRVTSGGGKRFRLSPAGLIGLTVEQSTGQAGAFGAPGVLLGAFISCGRCDF
jgi:hypothetical protein